MQKFGNKRYKKILEDFFGHESVKLHKNPISNKGSEGIHFRAFSLFCGGIIALHGFCDRPIDKGVEAFAMGLCMGLDGLFTTLI